MNSAPVASNGKNLHLICIIISRNSRICTRWNFSTCYKGRLYSLLACIRRAVISLKMGKGDYWRSVGKSFTTAALKLLVAVTCDSH